MCYFIMTKLKKLKGKGTHERQESKSIQRQRDIMVFEGCRIKPFGSGWHLSLDLGQVTDASLLRKIHALINPSPSKSPTND